MPSMPAAASQASAIGSAVTFFERHGALTRVTPGAASIGVPSSTTTFGGHSAVNSPERNTDPAASGSWFPGNR